MAVGRLLRHKHFGFHALGEVVLTAHYRVIVVLADLILSDITSSAH